MDSLTSLLLASVVANGLLSGASLDQSIKQLPARHRIGVLAFSEYSKASDLANGVPWYATLGVGGGLLSVATGVYGLTRDVESTTTAALWALILLTVAHSLVTSQAAPTDFSQREAAGDANRLTAIFNRFARLQTLRVTLQVAALGAAVWGLASRLQS
jgi:hypothetical protein